MIEKFGEPTFVYAIADRGRGLLKIGKSLNPQQRLKAIKTGNAGDLRMWGFCKETPTLNERLVHQHLRAYRVVGEWFYINRKTVDMVNRIRSAAGLGALTIHCPGW